MKIFCRSVIGLVFAASIFFANASFAQLTPGAGALYPYSVGSTIVLRDEQGGLPVDKLFSRRVSNPGCIGLSTFANDFSLLPAQFEVKVESGTYDKTSAKACASGWRLPTYNESLLIWLVRTDLVPTAKGWSLTTTPNPQDRPYCILWDHGEIRSGARNNDLMEFQYRICIRDIDTRSLGLSDL